MGDQIWNFLHGIVLAKAGLGVNNLKNAWARGLYF